MYLLRITFVVGPAPKQGTKKFDNSKRGGRALGLLWAKQRSNQDESRQLPALLRGGHFNLYILTK
jgi:hypothetical protein